MERPAATPPLVLVLGGGQLGLMLGLAAGPLGLRCAFVDPGPDAPARTVGPLTVADLADVPAITAAARDASVVTYEWEGVPAASARAAGLAAPAPVRPDPRALEVASDRLREKQTFGELDIAVPPHAAVDDRDALIRAIDVIGLPAVLKTRRGGYDGKGQLVLRSPADVDRAWATLGGEPLLLEGLVGFRRELSVLAARGLDGTRRTWPLVENLHVGGILRMSRAPAPGVTPHLQAQAEVLAGRVLEALDYVGVGAIELFQRTDGTLLANEFAPRVHNSGHWTIEGAATSQFTQHLRAITGRTLHPTTVRGHAAMVNCLGEVPTVDQVRTVGGAHLHDYGKVARPGRKMGHVTVVAPSASELDDRLADLAAAIPGLVPHQGSGPTR